MSPLAWFLIALGGALGSLARAGLSLWLSSGRFPWGTISVNLAGSFLLGLVVAAAAFKAIDPPTAAFLGLGFCGAFTTFSTFSVETLALIERGALGMALLNLVSSVSGALICASLGLLGGRALWS
jgi:CrcB protein